MNELRSLDISPGPEGVKAVIEFSGGRGVLPEFSKNNLDNPERIYFDFKSTVLAAGLSGSRKPESGTGHSGGPVSEIRISQHSPNVVRVVFAVRPGSNLLITRLAEPERLVLEFTGSTEGSLSAGEMRDQALKALANGISNAPSNIAGAADTPGARMKPEQKHRTAVVSAGEGPKAVQSGIGTGHKWCIVIDPGHGGHDPGAVSKRGLKEKDVTLAVALELARILGKDPRYEVHLTRSTDVYLTLEQRTLIANKLNADLFLSVHVNSSPTKGNRGIETYFLNWTDDEEANRVAARENLITLRRMKENRSELGYILASLELQGKRDDSLKLANYVQKSLTGTIRAEYPDVPGLGVKYALFYVLVGARMPSALVEVSFLSDPKEERYLRSGKYLGEIANGIAQGIGMYLQDSSSAPQVAKR